MSAPRPADDFPPTWFLLRCLPRDVPASVRMRRALKCLLRSFAIKCEAMRDEPPAAGDGLKCKGGSAP
jgi:hypothetical protein